MGWTPTWEGGARPYPDAELPLLRKRMDDIEERGSELREENLHRARMGLPSSVLRARTDLWPREKQEYLYPVHDKHESLDERVLDDLLRRVQRLEHTVAAQHEVIRNLVAWRFSRSPRAPVQAPADAGAESLEKPKGRSGTW